MGGCCDRSCARRPARVVIGVRRRGAAKIADPSGTRSALGEFGLPRPVATATTLTLPPIELAVAVGLLVPFPARPAGLVAFGLFILFMTSISVSLLRGRAPDCHCFGQLHSSPIGWVTLLRDACLAALAAVVVVAGASGAEVSPFIWLSALSAPELALVGAVICLAAVLVAQGWFLLELLRQQGRLLTRP